MQLQSFYIVRFNDCDPLGHLNNARYLDYMLNAREDHLRDFHGLTLPEFYKQGLSWVVRHHDIQYLRPALYNEKVGIISRLIELGESTLVVEFVMFDENLSVPKAILWTTFTCVDPKTGRKKQHSPEFMELAAGMQVHNVNRSAGIGERAKELVSATT